jgi:hypothetical protein
MGTWERGGRLQGNGWDQGSGTQARRNPERPVWGDWHLFGPKPLCPLFVCIRAVPNPSWGLLNNFRVLGCVYLYIIERHAKWVSAQWPYLSQPSVMRNGSPPNGRTYHNRASCEMGLRPMAVPPPQSRNAARTHRAALQEQKRDQGPRHHRTFPSFSRTPTATN